jgi:hypothetical protein
VNEWSMEEYLNKTLGIARRRRLHLLLASL